MSRRSRKDSGQVVLSLVVSGLLAYAIPGCGDDGSQKGDSSNPVPKNVQASNKNMENFMKSQGAQKK